MTHTNPKCFHNLPHSCEECGHYWPDHESDGRPVCHNDSDEGYTPNDTAYVRENEVGLTYCKTCGHVIQSDGYGNFPDACPGCGGNLDWGEWKQCDCPDAPSSTAGDYSPSNPWNAPGMSVQDFI